MSSKFKQRGKKLPPRPFKSMETENDISIGFFGDKNNPKLTFTKIIRDADGNPIRYERGFYADDLFALCEALDIAAGVVPTTDPTPLPSERPGLNAYLNPVPEFQTVVGERLDGSRYKFTAQNPNARPKSRS